MINQVKASNTPNAYAAFNTMNAVPYAISQPITKKQVEEKKHSHWLQITLIALATGFGVLALMKGPTKGSRSMIDNAFRALEDKIANSENKNLSSLQASYIAALKKIRSLGKYVKALYNTAPLKDILVKKSLEKVPFLKNFSNWITRVFERVSFGTSKRAYSSASYNFDGMCKNFDDLNKKILAENKSENIVINGQSRSAKSWVAELENRTKNLKEHYQSGFGLDAQKRRLVTVKDDLKDLDDQVWAKMYGDFWSFIKNPKTYNSFLSEDLAAGAKSKMNLNVNGLRTAITNDINDSYLTTKKVLKDVDSSLSPSDRDSRKILRSIKRTLDDWKHDDISSESKLDYNTGSAVLEKLDELLACVTKSDKYSNETKMKIAGAVSHVKTALCNDKKGEIQEILTIYNKLLPKSEYEPLKRTTYSAVHSLDRAIDREADKLFDKLRDLEIGAAPTDTLGVISSAGIVAWWLSKADDNKERVSVALKYGIPAVGAVATTLYCTLGLVSGGASLAIGLISGILISKLGVVLDNIIKKQTKQEVSKI